MTIGRTCFDCYQEGLKRQARKDKKLNANKLPEEIGATLNPMDNTKAIDQIIRYLKARE